jgi:hypothetical protein
MNLESMKDHSAYSPGSYHPRNVFDIEIKGGTDLGIKLKEDVEYGEVYLRKNGASSDTLSCDNILFILTIAYLDENKEIIPGRIFFTNLESYKTSFITGFEIPLPSFDYSYMRIGIHGILDWIDGKGYKTKDIVWALRVDATPPNLYIAKTNMAASSVSPDNDSTNWDFLSINLSTEEELLALYYYLTVNTPDTIVLSEHVYDNPYDYALFPSIFKEEDPIVPSGDDTMPLVMQYDCNKFMVNLSGLNIDNIQQHPGSNTSIRIIQYDNYPDGLYPIKAIFSGDLDNNGNFHFKTTEDGVFIVQITYNGDVIIQEYIFSNCNVHNCWLNLIDMIYCNDIDCCKNCSEKMLRERDFRRNELEKLNAFMSIISGYINFIKLRYSGVIVLGDEIHMLAGQANEYYKKIKEIVARCGTCEENLVNKSKPCEKC